MSFRSLFRRPVVIAASALATGALLAAGFSGAAFASSTETITLHLVSATGAPVKDAEIDVYSVVNDQVTALNDQYGDEIEADPIDKTGDYQMSVPDGQYTFYLYGTGQSGTSAQYFGGAAVPDDARVITVSSTSPTNIGINFAASGTISGKVTNSSGKPLKDICAVIWTFDGTKWVPLDTDEALPTNLTDADLGICDANTGKSGTYSVNPGSAGSYAIEFYDEAGKYLDQFSNGVTDVADATPVDLSSGGSAKVDTKLALGGTLKGTLHFQGADELELGLQKLTGTPGHFTAATPQLDQSTGTDAHGGFSFIGLATGYYVIQYEAEDGDSDQTGFIGGSTALTASVYSVTAGQTTTTVNPIFDGFLNTGGLTLFVTHSGDDSPVTDLSYAGLALISATGGFYQADGDSSTGTYTFSDVPAGDYSLIVEQLNLSGTQAEYNPVVKDVTIGAGESSTSVSLSPLVPLAYTTSPSVTEPSSVQVGQTFAADPGAVTDPTGDTQDYSVSYQWYHQVGDDTSVSSNIVPIRGAQSSTYVARAGDIGSTLAVRVTTSHQIIVAGLFEIVDDSVTDVVSATDPVLANSTQLTNVTAPTIADPSDVAVGDAVNVTPGTWSPANPRLSYNWTVGGTPVVGDYGPSYTPLAGGVGQDLTVTVTARKDGYPDADPITIDAGVIGDGAAPVVTKKPTTTSKTSHGVRTFTSTAGTWSIAGGTPSYQWYLDGHVPDSSIPSTSSTFSTAATGAISVVVTYSVAGYNSGTTNVFVAKGVAPAYSAADIFDVTTDSDLGNAGHTVANGDKLYTFVTGNAQDGSALTVSKVYLQTFGTHGWTTKESWNNSSVNPSAIPNSVAPTTARFELSVSSPDYATATIDSYEFDVAPNNNLAGVGTVSIPATAPIGSTVSAAVTGYPSGVSKKYQWQVSPDGADTWTNIAKATSSSLALKAPLVVNGYVRVEVTASESGSNKVITDSGALKVATNQIVSVGSPLLSASGPLKVGATVSTTMGTYNVTGVSAKYQWQLSTDGGTNFKSIKGATKSSYKTLAADVGMDSQLRVEVTASKSGYKTADPNKSIGIAVVADPTDKLIVTAVPLGAAVFATTVTAPVWTTVFTAAQNEPLPGAKVTYQWKLSGKSIKSQTATTFTPTLSDIGHGLSVTESFTSGVYGSASYTTKSVTVEKATAPVQHPTITAPAEVPGGVLTATTDVAGSDKYQWQLAPNADGPWTNIPSATHSTYTVPLADAGGFIRVQVSVTVAGLATSTEPSDALSVGYLGTIASVTAPTLHSNQVGVAGSVDPGSFNTDGVTLSYQWLLDDVAIPGATAATYTPLGSAALQDISVTITASKPGWISGSVTTADQELAIGPAVAPTPLPKITGTAKACSTLTVATGSWPIAGVFTYAWFKTVDGTTTQLNDADNVYVVQAGDVGAVISAEVTIHPSGYRTSSAGTNDVTITGTDCGA